MMDGRNSAVWGLGGLVLGYVAGRWSGYGCGGPGYGYGGPGYGYGHGCGGPGYGYGAPGYYTGDRPCHEDKQDDRIACLEAQVAAVAVADRKNEKIAFLEDKIIKEELKGDIFRATCMKPDGRVFLSPNHLANAYRGESRVLDSHQVFGGRDGRRGFCNDDCNDGFNGWY